MKTTVDYRRGVVTELVGDGFFVEETWDDLNAVIVEDAGMALTFEGFRDTGFSMKFFRHDANMALFMTYQMPHQWSRTAVHPHIHVIPMTTGSGDVVMNYIYAWSRVNNGAVPAASGWTTGSVTASFVAADAYLQKVIDFGYLTPPSDAVESSILLFKIERVAESLSDTYTQNKDHGTAPANLAVLFCDLHYQKEKLGTISEYPEF